jgi:hypothetical protein
VKSQGIRPSPLVNGQCCFTDADVAAVDATQVEQLAWRDYAIIFNVTGCAVLPEQRLWFLPHAFAYARREPDDAYEFLPSLLYFIADRSSPLDAALIEECRDEIRECFRAWTAEFDASRAETCVQLLTELCRFLQWIPLAEELFESLLLDDRCVAGAAWFLELSRRFLQSCEPAVQRSRIPQLANDVAGIDDAR